MDNSEKRIEYYDSLGNEFRQAIDVVVNFLKAESINKKASTLEISEWKLLYKVPNIPLQENYYDCGVFACKYAEYIARRSPLTFKQVFCLFKKDRRLKVLFYLFTFPHRKIFHTSEGV